MIGVLCKDNERAAAEEFFQLFKTPWQFVRDVQSYEVVMSTTEVRRDILATCHLVFSSHPASSILPAGCRSTLNNSGGIRFGQLNIPIYGKLATFSGPGNAVVDAKDNQGAAGLVAQDGARTTVVLGYDLFNEVATLLSAGQPLQYASIPTLDRHIALVRKLILDADLPLLEIPPSPAGYQFSACLTHDVDFVGIRQHGLDPTFLGFVYRAVVGSIGRVGRGQLTLKGLLQNWLTVLSLPMIWLGWRRDPWLEFDHYREIEKDYKSTFFMIPFKDRPGSKVTEPESQRRATRYDISEVQAPVKQLANQGFEIGLHGIDAWHDTELAGLEKDRITGVVGDHSVGVRMHWLCFDAHSPGVLERAGFNYDATCGYNETVGFKAGTAQVFRPAGARVLLELPLHIQDVAMFYPTFLNLSTQQAASSCQAIFDEVESHGGVVTLLWHMRSLAPERLWGDFYKDMLKELDARGAWFATAEQIVQFFRQRRAAVFGDVCFEGGTVKVNMESSTTASGPPLMVRVYYPFQGPFQGPFQAPSAAKGHSPKFVDTVWQGEETLEILLDLHNLT